MYVHRFKRAYSEVHQSLKLFYTWRYYGIVRLQRSEAYEDYVYFCKASEVSELLNHAHM